MAALSVAAIVVSHARADYLSETLSQLSKQSHFIEQVVVVETSSDQASLEAVSNFDFSVITPGDLKLGAAIQAGLAALAKKPGWIWVLHEDSAPEYTALAQLAKAAEISPSVALIGPKLLNWENPIEIQQMGLTITKSGRPFLLVQKEYDQGQHDAAGDTLAVSTAGMLVSVAAWEKLGGLNDKTPVFAQDLEFGAKARAAGFRVIVEAGARVSHAGLSMRSKRSRKWLGGTLSQGLARAHIHMATLTFPLIIAIALYLAMPLIAILSIPKHLISKRPGRILGQLSGWLWAWGTAPRRFGARAQFRKLGSPKPLRSLYATRAQLKKRRAQKLSEEPLGDPRAIRATIFSSNSIWLGLIPLLASFKIFPLGPIVTQTLSPLGSNAQSVFEATGVARLPFLSGIELPSDPFNWYLAFISWLIPNNPSLALAVVVFISPAFSFIGVWLLSSIFVSKVWVRNLVSVGFSLSPFALGMALAGQIVELTALNSAIWATFFLIRGSIAINSARSWRWVGLAGLAMAVTAVSSPLLFGVLVILLIGLSIRFWRKSAILIWALLPGVALLAPWALVIGQTGWLFLTTSSASSEPQGIEASYPVAVFLVLGLGALLVARLSSALPIFLFAVASFSLSFLQPVTSGAALVGFSAVCLSVAIGLLLENLQGRVIASSITAVALIASIGSAAFLVNASSGFETKDQRQLPSLVVAAAEQSDSVRTLVLKYETGAVAELIWGDGRSLENRSVLVQHLALPLDPLQADLAELSARLLAGNSNGVAELSLRTGVHFVLLESEASLELGSVAAGISAMPSFQPAGNTPFGALWRTDTKFSDAVIQEPNPVRNLQLGLISAFVLLAIPTRASVIGSRKIKRSSR